MNKKVFKYTFLLAIIIISVLIVNNYRCYICGSFPASEVYADNRNLCHECYTKLSQSTPDNSIVFTNKFGTSNTLCVIDGCDNKIATSGDTNCCIEHSNRCLECNCYIDGDAAYCMSCLENATN